MQLTTLKDALDRIETDLRHNILPFWIEHVFDCTSGRFHGALSNALVIDRTVERGALLSSRILWTYSAAYRQYRDPAYLAMAEHAYADLQARFRDAIHGGYFWSVAADGGVLHARKQVYGQAFAIYALSEFYAATARQEVLDEAIYLFRLIELHARERSFGGYLEAFDRAWQPIDDMRLSAVDQNAPKSQNTHLHIMEAYTNLLRVWPDASLRKALADLVEIMLTHIVDAGSAHLGLFFNEDWTPTSSAVSYGHDIEAAWLLTDAACILMDPTLEAKIKALAERIAAVTLAEGIDGDGGLYCEGGPKGITNSDKEWWPQAEAVIGFLNAYQISGAPRFLETALRSWSFIETYLVDHEHGEWFRGVNKEGLLLVGALKVSFWKCPYHNGRMGMEAVRRLRSIIDGLHLASA